MLNKVMFQEWLTNPVTVEVRKFLRKLVEDKKGQWVNGEFLCEGQFATAIAGARAVGFCETAQVILDLEFEQIESELDNE